MNVIIHSLNVRKYIYTLISKFEIFSSFYFRSLQARSLLPLSLPLSSEIFPSQITRLSTFFFLHH